MYSFLINANGYPIKSCCRGGVVGAMIAIHSVARDLEKYSLCVMSKELPFQARRQEFSWLVLQA
jgi:hypothetical protein